MTTPADKNNVLSPDVKVNITGRNVEVPDHFAERVHSKLAKIARLDPTLTFFHVELQHEPNPRRADESDKIQITATGKGHIARAEAKEDSFYAALETALSLTAGKRGGRLTQMNVAKTNVMQGLKLVLNPRNVGKKGKRLMNRHIEHVGNGFAVIENFQSLAIIALTMANLTRHVNIRQEVHLNFNRRVFSTLTPSLLPFSSACLCSSVV